MGRTGQVCADLLPVFSQRSRSLTLSGVTRVSRLGWTILVCTQALLFLADFAWADPFRVVAIGASNTSGWIVSSEQAYPQVLEQMLRTAGYEVQIMNSGRPFDTTAGMVARLDSAVPDRTDLVILQPGANDRRFFVSAERRANNIAEIQIICGAVGSRLSSSIPFFRTITTASTVSTSHPKRMPNSRGAHAPGHHENSSETDLRKRWPALPRAG